MVYIVVVAGRHHKKQPWTVTEVGERLTAQPANLSPCGNEKKAMLGEIEYGCQG